MWTTKLTSIDSKKGKWKLILITGIFAFIFINTFEPFGLYNSMNQTPFEIFLEISIAIITVVITLIFSHFFIKKALRIHTFTYATIFVWFLFESILIGAFWTLLTVLFDGLKSSVFTLWGDNVIECIFLIVLPYFATVFYLNFKEKSKTVDDLLEIVNEKKVNPESMVSFSEASGAEKLGIFLKNILYLESSDNYVVIHYHSNQKVEKYILRNTLKNLERELHPFKIMRCHRSYMVNPINVASKIKTTKGLALRLKSSSELVVPVSKPYVSVFERIF